VLASEWDLALGVQPVIFAHSRPGRPFCEGERLCDHLSLVAELASGFAAQFGCRELARTASLLHDIGKCSAAFQSYLQLPTSAKGPDHSTAGAREAAAAYPGPIGRMLAYAIAGHHAGLADFDDLDRRVTRKIIEPYAGWQACTGPLPEESDLKPSRPGAGSREPGFGAAFLTRMLFSCLVDADSLATERFHSEAAGEPVDRGGHASLAELRDRLRRYMSGHHPPAAPAVNDLRAGVLRHAVERAALAPGLFTLTVPTGGGKTLASLSFALEHAVRHGLRRVVYVIPFTAIVEQTAGVFRKALCTERDVLEHHASFDWDRAQSVAAADSEGPDGIAKLRRAAENWDVPVVVTTAVQFFESLFANRRAALRSTSTSLGTAPPTRWQPLKSGRGISRIWLSITSRSDGHGDIGHTRNSRSMTQDPPLPHQGIVLDHSQKRREICSSVMSSLVAMRPSRSNSLSMPYSPRPTLRHSSIIRKYAVASTVESGSRLVTRTRPVGWASIA